MSVPYHRLFRVDPRFRWWRPFVALGIFLGFYIGSQLIIGVAYIVPIAVQGGAAGVSRFATAASSDALSSANPVVFSMTLVSLIVLLPAMMVAVRLAGLGGLGQLASVRLRFRWDWAVRCLLPLAAFTLVMVVLQFWGAVIIDGGALHWNTAAIGHPTVGARTLVIAIVMIVVGVPFQAAAEEYVFRGFILQSMGSWIRNPLWGRVCGIVVSTGIFAVMHLPNGYNVWGILDVGSFGLIATFIILRTGGLEATVMQHAANNIVIFLFQAPGWSLVGTESKGSLGGALLTLGTSLLYWGLVELAARRAGLDRRRPGREAPRLRGAVPAWAGGTSVGWSDTPPHMLVSAANPRDTAGHAGGVGNVE